MTRWARRLLVTLAGAIVLVGCPYVGSPPCRDYIANGGCPDATIVTDSGQRDSGRDSGRPDARPDTSVDVGIDSNADSGPSDPQWVPMPDLPADCHIDRAEHPERIASLEWTNCGPGCLRAVPERFHNVIGFGDSAYSDGRGWAGTISLSPDPTLDVYAVMPMDGPPVAAWRMPHSRTPCFVSSAAFGGGRAGVVLGWAGPDGFTDMEDRIYAAPYDALGSAIVPEVILRPPQVGSGRWTQFLGIGADLSLMSLAPAGEIYIAHGGTVDAMPPGGGFAIDGDHVVWEANNSLALRHWVPEVGVGQIYYASPDGNLIGWPFADHGTLVWIELYPMNDSTGIVWTSPFTRSSGGVVPRVVTTDGGRPLHALAGDGLFVAGYGPDGPSYTAQITDIADGRIRILPAPEPGMLCGDLRYVSSTEIMLQCEMPGVAPRTQVLYRIDPRTLPYVP